MATFTNGEVIQRVLPALEELGRLRLPITGAWRVRRIRKKLVESVQIVEETRLEALKRYVNLNEDGEIAWQEIRNGQGQVVGNTAEFLSAEARENWNKEYLRLMGETIDWDGPGLQKEHLPRDDQAGRNEVTADLLFRLGDLIEEEEPANE